MKTIKISFFIIYLSFLFLSCASFPKADNKHDTMLIGVIIQQGKNFKIYGSGSVNGTNKVGIEFSLRSLTSGKIYTMKTWTEGIFHSEKIPEGIYKINRIYFRKGVGISWIPKDNEYKIEIISGKVNNLGIIKWESEVNEKNLYVKNTIYFNRDYEQAKDIFKEQNKSSDWNEKDWIDTKIIKETIKVDQ